MSYMSVCIAPPPNFCGSSPCQNGGTCSNQQSSYSCNCPAGFVGRNCEMGKWDLLKYCLCSVENVTCSLYAAVQVQSPPSISVGPSRIYVPIYEQANFLCLVEGSPKPSIAWFKDGVEIPGEKSQFLIIRSATFSDRGNYYCTATNVLGTATSDMGYLGLYGMYTQI